MRVFPGGSFIGAPVIRGINSMQLRRSDGRWWVDTILRDNESDSQPIPVRCPPRG